MHGLFAVLGYQNVVDGRTVKRIIARVTVHHRAAITGCVMQLFLRIRQPSSRGEGIN